MQKAKLVNVRQAAHLINAKPNLLVSQLVKEGIFKKTHTGENLPTYSFIEKGLFRTELTDFKRGPVTVQCNKALVTSHGIEFLRDFVAQRPTLIKTR